MLSASAAVAQEEPPSVLPLLPVTDGVLFPGVSEEIQIIAPEHIVLVEDAVRGDGLIGLVTLQPDSPADENNHHAIFQSGVLCAIGRVSRPGNGQLYITVRALAKIRIQEEQPGRVYRVGRVETIRETLDPADRDELRQLRQQVDELARAVDPVVLGLMSDAERINTLAFYLNLDLFERQSLLDTDGPIARARAMIDLLTMKLAAKPR